MITDSRRKNTAVVVLHEIYGINQHISKTCEAYQILGYDIYCPDLLHRSTAFPYAEQNEAYHYFVREIGFAAASRQIIQLLHELKPNYQNIFLLGYSIGATTAWLCSEEGLCSGIVGYYGSRIRDYRNIQPQCPVLLLFPSREKDFDVNELAAFLKEKANTRVHILEGEHGFCDPFAPTYQQKSAAAAEVLSKDFISSLSPCCDGENTSS